MTDYASRLSIPVSGLPSREFFSPRGKILAVGYVRVVIGKRGPYVEFDDSQVKWDSFNRVDVPHYYYLEFRSIPEQVKLYRQIYTVDYADYLPGKSYISPFEMFVDGKPIIQKLQRKRVT